MIASRFCGVALAMLFLVGVELSAQPPVLGASAYAPIPPVPGLSGGGTAATEYPDVKSLLMPTRNMRIRQMDPFYAACAAAEYHLNTGRLYKINLSPDYLNLRLLTNNPDVGSILELLQHEGTVSAGVVPYGTPRLTRQSESTEHYRINGYVTLFPPGASPAQRADRIREALRNGHPVIATFNVRRNFLELPARETHYRPEQGNTEAAETHTLLVTHYHPGEGTFELMNSWGSSWGERGCVRVDHRDFADMVAGAWVVVP